MSSLDNIIDKVISLPFKTCAGSISVADITRVYPYDTPDFGDIRSDHSDLDHAIDVYKHILNMKN